MLLPFTPQKRAIYSGTEIPGISKEDERRMNVAPIIADGWKFELIDSKLSITSEQDSHSHVQLSANAAFSLLNYLYQERDELSEAAQQETSEQVEHKKAELSTQGMQDNARSE